MRKICLIFIFIFLALFGYALEVSLFYGNLDFLKGQSSINIKFTYNNMSVSKYATEKEYVEVMKDKFEKKQQGWGAKWEEAWIGNREGAFEPRFKKMLEKHLKIPVDVKDSKYTMIFKTKYIEPGWEADVVNLYASIDGEAWFVETEHPENVVAKIIIKDANGKNGSSPEHTAGARIREAYGKAGKELGKFIYKIIKRRDP